MEHNKSQSISRAELNPPSQQGFAEFELTDEVTTTAYTVDRSVPTAQKDVPTAQKIVPTAQTTVQRKSVYQQVNDAQQLRSAKRQEVQYSFALEPYEPEAVSPDQFCDKQKTLQRSVDNTENVARMLAKPVVIAESIWVSMPNGEQLHMRHLIPCPEERKTDARLELAAGIEAGHEFAASQSAMIKRQRIFMLHGEVECGRIFYNDSGKGLAYHFAEQGYEVFVADLGGRGRSLAIDGKPSALSVHDIVTEAIPRLLRAATNCRSAQVPEAVCAYGKRPDIWVAHGFGGALLSAAWARMSEAERSATQMIFFGSRRKLQARNRLATAFVKAFCHPLTERLVNWQNAFPATRMRLGSADENAHWFRIYAEWMNCENWCDSEDGFDYHAALQAAPLPPTLYFGCAADKVYAQVEDIRRFIEELGCHDARMVVLNTIATSNKPYDHLSMLLNPAATQDVFPVVDAWLTEQGEHLVSAQANCAATQQAQPAARQAGAEQGVTERLTETEKDLVLCA